LESRTASQDPGEEGRRHHHAPPPATTTTTAATGRIREREGRIRPGEEGGGEGHPPEKKKGEGRVSMFYHR